MKNVGCIISQSERPDSNRRLTLQWDHAPSRLEKRSVVMTLEDHSHGGHRAVANYFYEGKNENFEGSSKAALLPC